MYKVQSTMYNEFVCRTSYYCNKQKHKDHCTLYIVHCTSIISIESNPYHNNRNIDTAHFGAVQHAAHARSCS